jgi:carbonic anhydrase
MSFCAVVNCMDGRVQLPVIEHLMRRFGVEYVDSITEAGPVRMLGDAPDSDVVASILSRIAVSVGKHGARTVAVVAHHDCAGNPVSREAQLAQLERAIALLAERFPGIDVVGLWVDERWQVSETGA